MFEDSEAIRDEKKQAKDAKELDAERADVMRDDEIEGMSKRKRKHDSFKELMELLKARNRFTKSVELRKVANKEKRLALEKERLPLERQGSMAFIDVLKGFTTRLPQLK